MSYYGYKLKEVLDMKKTEFDYLFEAMEIAQAQDHLKKIEVATYPYLSKDQMRKTHKALYDKAIPQEDKQEKIVTTADIMKLGFNSVAGAPR
jgi:hypothetical protein